MKKTIIAAIVALMASVSMADLLVSYGLGDYVTVNQSFQRGNNTAAAFSTAALSPAANYTGPVFFGGYTGNTAMGVHMVQQNASGFDRLTVGSAVTTVGTYSTLLAMFATQSPSTITQVVWSVIGSTPAASQTNFVSLVVQKGSSYYISEQMSRYYVATVTNSAPGSLAWYNYDPATSLMSSGTQVSGFTLDNVTAIGQWTESLVTVAGGTSSASLNVFKAYGTIPEPATIGMLGLGALVTLLVRRMRG